MARIWWVVAGGRSSRLSGIGEAGCVQTDMHDTCFRTRSQSHRWFPAALHRVLSYSSLVDLGRQEQRSAAHPAKRVEGTSSSAAATARTSLSYHRRGTPGLLCAGDVCGPSQQSTIDETGGATPPAAYAAGVGGALWRWCADSLLVHTRTHTHNIEAEGENRGQKTSKAVSRTRPAPRTFTPQRRKSSRAASESKTHVFSVGICCTNPEPWATRWARMGCLPLSLDG